MKYFLSFIIFLLLLMQNNNTSAQSISDHQWEDRLLLIFVKDTTDVNYQAQLTELERHQEGLLERKIRVYQIQPVKIQSGLSPKGNWENNTDWFNRYKKEKTNFEIQLIGLDGGVKKTQSTPMACEELFAMIDQMPMRLRELRKKRQ